MTSTAGTTAPGRMGAGHSALIVAAIAILVVTVGYQFSGVLQDLSLSLGYRFSLDYGEGIVWQQALLMFGPRMYSPSPDLPFIVFHYPPLYHVVVRALMTLGWDPLLAGRLISVVSTVVCAASIVAMIMLGVRGARSTRLIVLAVTIAVMFLCLNAIRTWGMLMRVDMLAEALGLVGTVVFVRSRSSTAGTMVALILCVASVFTKQTQLPAGIAIFGVAFICDKRAAVIGGLVAGSIGVVFAAALELKTGGFFKNIISYNVNPFTFHNAITQAMPERRSAPVMLVMLVSVARVVLRFHREGGWTELRNRDRRAITEIVITAHFVMACFSAVEIFKDGGSTNYFIDLLATGCVLIGLSLYGLMNRPMVFAAIVVALTMSTAILHHRYRHADELARMDELFERVVQQIAAADRPVTSDDMVLVMRAGKSLIFEPAIVRALVAQGKWDPAPLIAMIRDHGFAFALTYTGPSGDSPVIRQAISTDYPREVPVGSYFIAHYPPAAD